MDDEVSWSYFLCAAAARYYGPVGHLVRASGKKVDEHGPRDKFQYAFDVEVDVSSAFFKKPDCHE